MDENKKFEDTICNSKEESIARATEIVLQEMRRKEEERKTRKIERPRVSVIKGICYVCIYCVVAIALCVATPNISEQMGLSDIWVRIVIFAVLILTPIVFLKRILIYMIRLYQRFAPEKIRAACLFEPCCSEYMRLAIEKYGIWKGVHKGLKRLLRCHIPNGGIDYP